MKIIFASQEYENSQPQKQKTTFGAGLTPKMMHEIQQADILEISEKFSKKGVPVDFKENKVVAWCCYKVAEISGELKQHFGINFPLPKGIFLEDFSKLNIDSPNIPGFCNLQPTELHVGSKEITPSRVIFFNNFAKAKQDCSPQYSWLYDWNNINSIADINHVTGKSATNLFLDIFLHEFSHVFHEERLLDKLGGKVLAEKIETTTEDMGKIAEYRRKYGLKVSKICDYALTNPLDAVACDMSRVISNNLDKNTLMPVRNPFKDTPYEKLYFWSSKRLRISEYSDQDKPLTEILRNFWNGKFD